MNDTIDQTLILLVSSWNVPCGIAEHSAFLKDAVESQAPDLALRVAENGHTPAQPEDVIGDYEKYWKEGRGPKIVHLNYHAALHSRWVPEWIPKFQKQFGVKVVVTYHDTGVPNSPLAKSLHTVCDAMIVHEPAEDLPRAYYHRMGVPGAEGATQYGKRTQFNPSFPDDLCFKRYATQPVLGTIGFPFPWKNYDQLAKITGEIGWALLLLAPTATQEQIESWTSLNPDLCVLTDFTPRRSAISYLAGCDATAFTYVCHNTGQSAAILQGIAARKPVIALKTCRQFRALYLDPLGSKAIRWAETFEDVSAYLRNLTPARIDPRSVALAEQESWQKRGQEYISIYRSLL